MRADVQIQSLPDNILEILTSEAEYAVKTSKRLKSVWHDEVPAELIKILNDGNIVDLTKFLNNIYIK